MNPARALVFFLLLILALAWALLLPMVPQPGLRLDATPALPATALPIRSPANLRDELLLRLPDGSVVASRHAASEAPSEDHGLSRLSVAPGSAATDGRRLAVMRNHDSHLIWSGGAPEGPFDGFPLIPPGRHALLDPSGSVVTLPGASGTSRVADALPLSAVATESGGGIHVGFASGSLVTLLPSARSPAPRPDLSGSADIRPAAYRVVERDAGAPVLGIAEAGGVWIAVLPDRAVTGTSDRISVSRIPGISPDQRGPIRLAAGRLTALPDAGETVLLRLPRLVVIRREPGRLVDSTMAGDDLLAVLRQDGDTASLLDLFAEDGRRVFRSALPGDAAGIASDGTQLLVGYADGSVQRISWSAR